MTTRRAMMSAHESLYGKVPKQAKAVGKLGNIPALPTVASTKPKYVTRHDMRRIPAIARRAFGGI